jgi:hypothetical protein
MNKIKEDIKTGQKLTAYRPTVVEKKLLEILLYPEHRQKNVTEICQLAKCSRQSYYDAFSKPAFATFYHKESRDLVIRSLAQIINASIRQALRGDASHTKMLLTMAGLYTDKMVFPGKDGKPQDISPKVEMSQLERATRVAYLLRKGIERKKMEEENKAKQGSADN